MKVLRHFTLGAVSGLLALGVGLATRTAIFSLATMLIAMLAMILIAWLSSYRQHPHGMASQWTEPARFIEQKLNRRETIGIVASVGVALGAMGALFLQIRAA